MFGFFNTGLLLAVLMVIAVTFLLGDYNPKNKGKRNAKSKIIIPILLMIPFLAAYISHSTAIETIGKFKRGITFQCKQFDMNYLVSKEEKWRVEGVYFTKDSLLIRADNCEEFDNE